MNLDDNNYTLEEFVREVLKSAFPNNPNKQQLNDDDSDKLNFACPYCGDSKKDSSKKNKEDLEKIWGRDSHSLGFKVKIWSNYPKNQLESQRSKDEINLEKLWGARK